MVSLNQTLFIATKVAPNILPFSNQQSAANTLFAITNNTISNITLITTTSASVTTNIINDYDSHLLLDSSKKGDRLSLRDSTKDDNCPDQAHWIFIGVIVGLSSGIFLLYLLNCFRLTPEPASNNPSISA